MSYTRVIGVPALHVIYYLNHNIIIVMIFFALEENFWLNS